MLIQIQSKVNFIGNLDEAGGATMFFIIEETKKKKKKAVLDFSKRTVKVLWFHFVLI